MTNEYNTLLSYLGKEITFNYPVPIEYKESGLYEVTGKVISVCIELNENHQLCVLYDESSNSADFFEFDQMVFIK
ncbi:hypothetical protein [Acinetobacter sp. MD2(2019)]|uniref:hypothetical protein n=1 Tax=Acinetobacter sp. MD2(2019) TaxID=2605273 RepID=UPI002D1EB4B6|nr:hypothetical protein [Acinetobacter sp. MD2(2019)]MEB3754863.1 hypothetical protein [Acinetobacter sp. MD2(2019)]